MEDLEFQLNQRGIEIIHKRILDDLVALRKWIECIYSLVTNPSSRKRLRDEYYNGRFAEVTIQTLEEWLVEQGSNATFGKLIEHLREHKLNSLCDELLEKEEEIRKYQGTYYGSHRMEDLEFRLCQREIEIIQKHIVNDPAAQRIWPECIYTFVTNTFSRRKLCDEYHSGRHFEVTMKTLEEWLAEQGSNATFLKLVELLRAHNLNNLCDILFEKAEEISKDQLQPKPSTAAFEKGRNPSIWFGMADVPNFVGRVEELEKLHKLVTANRIQEHDYLALLTSVHGFGGIGKTTLARMYPWKHRTYFDGNVIWIDSETFGSMRVAFQRVAEELNLEVDTTNFDLNRLKKSVYNSFADAKCLFIFDNVEDVNGQNGVEQFLPSGIIRKPYLLLTSRRNDLFLTNRILQLDVLGRSDSIELVKKYIPRATNDIAEKLAERLDGFPLAIHQAIAYIKKLLPLQNKSSEDDVLKSINSFLVEYEYNSNKILKSEFKGVDGYARNIYSICEMSLRKMEHEEGGKFAKHMLGYISFLHPYNIYLDFVLNLPYQLENRFDKLQRIIRWSVEKTMDPSITVHLLSSYSLIDINTKEKILKVHRLVQDAIRFMLMRSEELRYIKHLLAGLADQEFNTSISHWMSIKRSCRFGPSISYFESVIPKGVIQFMEMLNSAGLNIGLAKKLIKIANKYSPDALSLITSILKAMKCNNINESVEAYLNLYNKIESALEVGPILLLTNYALFANFVISEAHKIIFQSVFECVSILQLKNCKRTFLLELFGTNFPPVDVSIVLDIINRSGIAVASGVEFKIHYLYNVNLFGKELQIPESLSNEFPCLNYLKLSSSFSNIDELQALNLSFDFKNSIVWSLLDNLKFNLIAVRSAIASICYAGCTISEYLENYNSQLNSSIVVYETNSEAEQGSKADEMIVDFVNAKLLRNCNPKCYALLALICCLTPEFSKPYRFKYMLDKLDDSKFQFGWRYLQKLENLSFVTEKSEDVYFMNSNLQVALRENVLSLEDKTQAVKDLHKTCRASRNGECYDEMVKYWSRLMEQKDLREIALNFNLSFGD